MGTYLLTNYFIESKIPSCVRHAIILYTTQKEKNAVNYNYKTTVLILVSQSVKKKVLELVKFGMTQAIQLTLSFCRIIWKVSCGNHLINRQSLSLGDVYCSSTDTIENGIFENCEELRTSL